MKYGIMGYVWSEWWSGMDYNLWNGVEKYPAIFCCVLFNCRKTSNFKFWNGNEVDEVWNEMNEIWNEVKYEWMNEMDGMKWNEMDHNWNGSELMIL